MSCYVCMCAADFGLSKIVNSELQTQTVCGTPGYCCPSATLLAFLFFIMAALWNTAGHYIFMLWFLSVFFFFSSPNLSGRRLDVYHTSTHGVALVRI